MTHIFTDIDLDLVRQVREEFWHNGFRPVPVLNPGITAKGGKRPAGSGQHWRGWEIDARQNPPYAVATKPSAIALNTGILADGLRAVDIDVDDANLADTIDRLAVDMLGNAPMRFREDSPRKLRLYRAAEGQPPHLEVQEDQAITAAAGRTKQWGVEVLGYGNQFVAVGWHPDGAFLDWKDCHSPTSVSRDELPAVTETQITEFLSIVGDLLGSKGSRQNGQIRQNPPIGGKVESSDDPFVGSGGVVRADGDVALADW
jgi:Bifunctional DNA primase/polymerase, N-terminal